MSLIPDMFVNLIERCISVGTVCKQTMGNIIFIFRPIPVHHDKCQDKKLNSSQKTASLSLKDVKTCQWKSLVWWNAESEWFLVTITLYSAPLLNRVTNHVLCLVPWVTLHSHSLPGMFKLIGQNCPISLATGWVLQECTMQRVHSFRPMCTF
jgi:hypothetical protein